MSLLGWPLLILAITLALACPAACLVLWSRLWGAQAFPVKVVLLVVSQATAVFAVGVGVNDHFQFFASWSDLSGRNGAGDAPIQQQNPGVGPRSRALSKRLRDDFRTDPANKAMVATFTGPRSGVRAKVWVWLPPEYRDHPTVRFPVVELFPGFPGTPTTWFHAMDGPGRLAQAVRQGAAQPYVLVAPTITVRPGLDTECSDVPAGPRVATWLTDDVRRLVTDNFRVLPGRDGWGAMGYSTGGYCAAKVAVQRPGLFRAAVSIAGYFSPATRALARVPEEHLPAVVRRTRPPVDLLLTGSRQDPGTVADMTAMVRSASAPTLVFTYVTAQGGHNTGVWTAMLPRCFQWLTTRLAHAT